MEILGYNLTTLVISAIFAAIFAEFVSTIIVPQDHGAGTPQLPGNKQFTSWISTFFRWTYAKLVAFFVGIAAIPKFVPIVENYWHTAPIHMKIIIAFVLSYAALYLIQTSFKDDVSG